MLCTVAAPVVSGVHAASFRPEKSDSGMVLSVQKIADEIGTKVLNEGGNAVDAAVAVGYALAVVHPVAGNLGGGGFAVIHTAKGENVALDFREIAPGKATRDMYLDKNGEVIPNASTVGYLAAGVPGTVAGMSAMLDKYGTRKLADLIQPAIRYAETGFMISAHNAEIYQEYAPTLAKFASTRKYFLKPDGSPLKEGDLLVQKDLARTLKLIAAKGPDVFYKGEVAELIVKDMAANGGIMTREDLARYSPVWRETVHGTYRGYDIYSMSPPSSGGTHIVQMLNVMEGYNLKEMGQNSSATIHVMAEAMRQAYADRSLYMGDPNFVQVPVKELTAKEYATDIRNKIQPQKATPSSEVKPGKPTHEGNNTTHFSIVDKWGNAVAITYTINDWWGSGAAVNGAGFMLNNEMDDFAIKPGVPNLYGLIGGDANAIEPYKRPLSSMSPTIVAKDGKLFMVLGSPGGSRIITSVLQVISNVIDHDMNIREAVDAPRIHMQWVPDELRVEAHGLAQDVINSLSAMGYTLTVKEPMGEVNAILVEPKTGLLTGARDPRGEF
ncbi:MAG: gamma-glutamyltransferase [Negativicutes bacterium]|nr:gamma-glutamyltransferase [Negativicutes bacterium]